MGTLTGGFFGDFIPQLLKLLNPESTFVWFWPPLFTPLDNTLQILIGSMARSRAAMEIGRSTSKVSVMCGNTVRPRRARTGRFQVVSSMCLFLSEGW